MNFSTRAIALVLALIFSLGIFSFSACAENGAIVSGIGFVNATALNLRAQPDVSAQLLATASCGECIVVLSQEGSWYHVIYNLQEGYMSAEYLRVSAVENAELGYGRIVGTSVNLRSGPSSDYPAVARAGMGETCYIIGLNQGWYKVKYQSQTCYVRSDFVNLTEIPYENKGSSNNPQYFRSGSAIGSSASPAAVPGSTGSATGYQILAKAQEFLGTPYVYGGASPSGFDCSGYVYYVLKCFGYSPDRTPEGQITMGTSVDKTNLQPGDIVFFAGTGGSGITHTGIYAGNGQFIHSPNSRSVVSYSDLNSGYWAEHYYAARRVATN